MSFSGTADSSPRPLKTTLGVYHTYVWQRKVMKFHLLSGLWRSYRRYIDNIETLIASLRKDVPLSDDDIQRLFEKPELELDLDYSYEETIENISSFPEVLRRSAFLSAFILLESNLETICSHLEIANNSPIKAKDLRGSGIMRASKYIRSLHNYEISSTKHWPEILRFQDIRNILVHSNGEFSEEMLNQPVGKYVKVSQLVAYEKRDSANYYVLSVKKGFCEHAATIIEEFFKSFPADLFPPSRLVEKGN